MKKNKEYEFTPSKVHYKRSFGDKLISVITYFVYSIFAFVCVYPFYYIFINSISSNTLSDKGKIIFLPHEIHFTNYASVMKLEGLFDAAKISLLRTGIGTLMVVFTSAFLGYMFTSKNMWGRKFWFRLIAATMYFNAGVIPLYITMSNLKLTNNFWIYVLPTAISPFYMILCKTFIEATPSELREAATIDGAGTLTIFFRIMLPVIKPILATVAIFTAVNQWNAFQDTLIYITDKKLNTLQFVLYQYITQSSSIKALLNGSSSSANIAASMAKMQTATSVRMTVTIVVVTPILLVYPFFQKYFTKGIMIGAVKG
ncbi:MAG: carbohydrate ABC transporter permease [Lachnospiraceae bacterium]|nr:carbohydrate ABC transporter permease [Lachnospiraceae bacterium]